jgi:hypothetical protein
MNESTQTQPHAESVDATLALLRAVRRSSLVVTSDLALSEGYDHPIAHSIEIALVENESLDGNTDPSLLHHRLPSWSDKNILSK